MNLSLNDFDCTVIEEALENYLSLLDENIPRLKNVSADDILLNVSSARSALNKIKTIRTNKSGMNLNEMKAVYVSVDMFLDVASSLSISSSEKQTASDFRASCAKILKVLSDSFSEAGYDIDSLLGPS